MVAVLDVLTFVAVGVLSTLAGGLCSVVPARILPVFVARGKTTFRAKVFYTDDGWPGSTHRELFTTEEFTDTSVARCDVGFFGSWK